MTSTTHLYSTHPQISAKWVHLFGHYAVGMTLEECAEISTVKWVRDQDHLARFTEESTGLVMSSADALRIFGLEKLEEANEYGCAIIVRNKSEPGHSLRKRRHEMDLDQHEVAKRAGISVEEVRDCESAFIRSNIHTIAKICNVLGLDPLSIGFCSSDLYPNRELQRGNT